MKRIEDWLGVRIWKRHSLVLLVAGLVYIMIGIAYLVTDSTPSRTESLKVALHWMSLGGWGWVFILSGLLAILSSRWPPFSETWGYTVLTGLSAGWAAVYLVGVIGGAPAQGLSGAMSWGLLAFMWWAISGLINPEDGNAVLKAEIAALQSELKALQTRRE